MQGQLSAQHAKMDIFADTEKPEKILLTLCALKGSSAIMTMLTKENFCSNLVMLDSISH